MRICFVGAGALGCSIGGVLTEGGSDVHLIDRYPAHVDAMNRDGLRIRDDAGERIVKVKAHRDANGIGSADLVIVLVKSYHTREAMEAAMSIVGPRTVVMSIQNGLGHEEILADVVGRDRVIAAKTYVGGVLLGPGHVLAGTRGKLTYIGELDGAITPRVEAIAAEFERADLRTIISSNIVGTMWDKLLINVATGALSSITRLTYGKLYAIDEIKACALAAVEEAMTVATAAGVKLSIESAEEAWIKAAEGLPADFKTSMLQSLEAGAKTEIDFINGAVVRWGGRCHVPTPVNSTLVACIKGIEQQALKPRAA
jgi:2-dehydropantoate 2-reductase